VSVPFTHNSDRAVVQEALTFCWQQVSISPTCKV